ncbi:MAG: 50S ribosomal protein L2 [Bacteroidetes bacterium]|nr:50S ribosomal protein L2 [Bacteroidota bacterium]MBU2585896.1 50S ribosomal protein L2 [Bacteroidota bacterium]
MGLKKLKPVTPGTRSAIVPDFSEITKTKPEKSLLRPLKRSGGRNNEGKLTSRHRGGGHKRRYRIIDFKRDKRDVPGKVHSVEYDPNRSVRIALLHYADGEKRYILAPNELKLGDTILAGSDVEIKSGNAMPLSSVPLGSFIHNIEIRPGKGGQIARGAGTSGQLIAREGKFAQIKLPSGEVRMIPTNCYATYGVLGNSDHENITLGKAGKNRWLGWRSYVRGVAMNPVDHPNGGGEGKSKSGGGWQHPTSPWGQKAKGLKTRKKKKTSSKYIVKRRK